MDADTAGHKTGVSPIGEIHIREKHEEKFELSNTNRSYSWRDTIGEMDRDAQLRIIIGHSLTP